MKASAFFDDAKNAAAQALKDGFGFQKAIDDLESFTTSEDYSMEALELISELKKSSDSAVGTLMDSLNEKAARLISAGNFTGAINVYNTDIGELAPESKTAREKKIREIEQMRRDAESIPGDASPDAVEEPLP